MAPFSFNPLPKPLPVVPHTTRDDVSEMFSITLILRLVTHRESDPEVTSFGQKSPGSGCRRAISQVLSTFELLQGYNLQEVVVTLQ